jgi:hypothetical protein
MSSALQVTLSAVENEVLQDESSRRRVLSSSRPLISLVPIKRIVPGDFLAVVRA